MIARLSWRNVWRSKLRSSVIIAAIAVGICAGVFSVGLFSGMTGQMLRNAIETQTAHIQLHTKNYTDNYDINLFVEEGVSLAQRIEQKESVKGVAPRQVVTAMLASSNGNAGIQLYGVYPDKEKLVSTIPSTLSDGVYFEKLKKNPIIISERTAEKFHLKVRSKVVVTMQDANGEIVGAAFRVEGIFKTANSAFDQSTAFVRVQDLQKITMVPEIHEISLKMNDPETVVSMQESLKSEVSEDLLVENWKEVQPELAYVADASGFSNMIFLTVILIALAFGILNTMLMSIYERIQELGVLMAVGMGKLKIFSMIVLETIYLSLVGGVVGMILGYFLIQWFGQRGIDLSAFSEGLEAYGMSDKVYPSVSPEFFIQLSFMVLVTALLASIYPAVKALKLKPAEAIRQH